MLSTQTHPEHKNVRQVVRPSKRHPDGVWEVAFPIHPKGYLGWKVRRRCRKNGGHWWHPADPMIAWACCVCGAQRDGLPRDGT